MTTHFAHDEASLTMCGRPTESVQLAPVGEVTCKTCERGCAA